MDCRSNENMFLSLRTTHMKKNVCVYVDLWNRNGETAERVPPPLIHHYFVSWRTTFDLPPQTNKSLMLRKVVPHALHFLHEFISPPLKKRKGM